LTPSPGENTATNPYVGGQDGGYVTENSDIIGQNFNSGEEICGNSLLFKKFKHSKFKQGCYIQCLDNASGFVLTGVNPVLYYYKIQNERLDVKMVNDFCKSKFFKILIF
jgi:hypothetical protein